MTSLIFELKSSSFKSFIHVYIFHSHQKFLFCYFKLFSEKQKIQIKIYCVEFCGIFTNEWESFFYSIEENLKIWKFPMNEIVLLSWETMCDNNTRRATRRRQKTKSLEFFSRLYFIYWDYWEDEEKKRRGKGIKKSCIL